MLILFLRFCLPVLICGSLIIMIAGGLYNLQSLKDNYTSGIKETSIIQIILGIITFVASSIFVILTITEALSDKS